MKEKILLDLLKEDLINGFFSEKEIIDDDIYCIKKGNRFLIKKTNVSEKILDLLQKQNIYRNYYDYKLLKLDSCAKKYMEIYKDTYEEMIIYKYKDEEIFKVPRYDYMSEKIFQNKLKKFQQLYPKMVIEKVSYLDNTPAIGICELCKKPIYKDFSYDNNYNDYLWMVSDKLWQKYSKGRIYHPLCFQAVMMKFYNPSDFTIANINYTEKSFAVNLFKDQYINFLSQYLPEGKKITSFKYSICSCGDICFVNDVTTWILNRKRYFFGQYQLKDYNKKKCLPCLCIDYGRKPLIQDFTLNEINIYSNGYIKFLNPVKFLGYLNNFFNSISFFKKPPEDPKDYCKKCKQYFSFYTVPFKYKKEKKASTICYLCACVEKGEKIPYNKVETYIDEKKSLLDSTPKHLRFDIFDIVNKEQEKYRFLIEYTKYLD